MQRRRLKYAIGLAVIVAAFVYLAWTSLGSSFQFALMPGEFLAKQSEYVGKSIKISGVVADGTLVVSGTDHSFAITDGEQSVRVHHKGMVPNTFREGAEVVAGGIFNESTGIFEATEVLAKCASKYQSR